jgi:hypothetical protein
LAQRFGLLEFELATTRTCEMSRLKLTQKEPYP